MIHKIQVYEHCYLQQKSDVGAIQDLMRFQKSHSGSHKYSKLKSLTDFGFENVFTVINETLVKFHQYVGAIQVGDTLIEILPKIDSDDGYYIQNDSESIIDGKWQNVLIEMLKECKFLKSKHTRDAFLNKSKGTLLDLMYLEFISLCDELLRMGLTKKYIPIEKNRKYLKGKLLFSKHVNKNHIHKERFYTRQNEYSYNHIFNQLLFTALNCVRSANVSSMIKSRASQLMFQFPEVDLLYKTDHVFENLVYDIKTEVYKDALVWAELILTQHLPNLIHGEKKLIALVFDMNKLWEEYLYSILKKEESVSQIHFNSEKVFWDPNSPDINAKRVKPDIILKLGDSTIVLDAKWKIPKDNRPSSTDLMQLFSYAMITGAENSYLVFPMKPGELDQSIDKKDGGFKLDAGKYSNVNVQGGYLRVSVLNKGGNALKPNLGNEIIKSLTQK